MHQQASTHTAAARQAKPARPNVSAMNYSNRANNSDWTTTEVAVLRTHYPIGGALECRRHLPKRSLTAIAHKASHLGIKAPHQHVQRFHAATALPEDHDNILRAWSRSGEHGWRSKAAAALGRSNSWVSLRLRKLGIAQNISNSAMAHWQPREIEILQEFGHLNAESIAKRLAAEGFKRTQGAIHTKSVRLGIDRTDPDRWTVAELSRLCGVSSVTALRWVDEHGLKSTRQGNNERGHRIVSRRDFRAWVKQTGAERIDLFKVEQSWFKDVMWGAA